MEMPGEREDLGTVSGDKLVLAGGKNDGKSASRDLEIDGVKVNRAQSITDSRENEAEALGTKEGEKEEIRAVGGRPRRGEKKLFLAHAY